METYLTGSMVKAFEEEVKREVDKQLQALREEELDVLHCSNIVSQRLPRMR